MISVSKKASVFLWPSHRKRGQGLGAYCIIAVHIFSPMMFSIRYLTKSFACYEKNASGNVICLRRLLHVNAYVIDKCQHTDKQCGPRSDCSTSTLFATETF